MPWVMFFVSAVVIVIAGTKLSQYGDQIARHTGLGGLWVGVLLMAGATSLPEVMTTISAAWLQAPDLAVGNLFGAVMSNMLALGIIDLFHRQKRVWQHASQEHTLSAALAVALTGLAGLCILLRTNIAVWSIGLDTLLIAFIYVLGMRVVYRQEDLQRRRRERERVREATEDHTHRVRTSTGERRRAIIGFALATLALVLAAPSLATAAKEIAEKTGIGTTFIGSSLVAVTTSLPELVTALAAVRLGAFDLAVGNLFGSNAFNMSVLFMTDIAYRPGPLLSVVHSAHVVTALMGILLMNIALMGIIYRAEKRFLLIEPDSFLMIVGYGLGMWVVFRLGG